MTMRISLYRRARLAAADRGSLAMVMLVVIVGMGLAALMLPLVLVQTHTTTFDKTRGYALQAAESGIDIAVGHIRTATTEGAGDFAKLPCEVPVGYDDSSNQAMEDTAATADSNVQSKYGAAIAYYASNPNVASPPAPLTCGSTGVIGGLPRYALITATGFAPNEARSRTLSATYVLLMPGLYDFSGQIKLYAAETGLCITADLTAQPNDHYPVTLQPCQQPVPDSQKFQFNSDYGIQLASAVNGQAMCLKTDGQSGSVLYLSSCVGGSWIRISSAYYGQQLRAPDTNNKDVSDYCLQTSGNITGATISLQGCAAFGAISEQQAWDPDIAPSWTIADGDQLLNLASGRCLDLAVLSAGASLPTFTYSCMLVPQPDKTRKPPWDQVFQMLPVGSGVHLVAKCTANTADTTDIYQSCPTSTDYCLTTTADSDGGGATMVSCSASDQLQIWTRNLKVSPSGASGIDNSYTIQDSHGLCLEEGTNKVSIGPFSYPQGTVSACDGSPEQKWNVPDAERTKIEQELGQGASLKDLHEK